MDREELKSIVERHPVVGGLVDEFSAILAATGPESAMAFLREAGVGFVASVRLLRLFLGIDLGEAWRLVLHSRTWADEREGIERLNREFWDALEACQRGEIRLED